MDYIYIRKNPLPYEKIGDSIVGHGIFFHFGVMFHESQTWSLMVNEKHKLYIVCTLILFNPFHLTIESILTLIQNELFVRKCYHANSKIIACV